LQGLIPYLSYRLAVTPGFRRRLRAKCGATIWMRRDGAALAPKNRIEPEKKPGSLLILAPVRSGQVLFADAGDLVVVAPVSSGAELIAHGSIHVYGRMSGRALAGVNGDRSARIFCQNFDADLVAIAGLYRSSDDFGASVRGTRAQAFLEDDSLKIEPLR